MHLYYLIYKSVHIILNFFIFLFKTKSHIQLDKTTVRFSTSPGCNYQSCYFKTQDSDRIFAVSVQLKRD